MKSKILHFFKAIKNFLSYPIRVQENYYQLKNEVEEFIDLIKK